MSSQPSGKANVIEIRAENKALKAKMVAWTVQCAKSAIATKEVLKDVGAMATTMEIHAKSVESHKVTQFSAELPS